MLYKLKSEKKLAEEFGGKIHRFSLGNLLNELRGHYFFVEPKHIKQKVIGVRGFLPDDSYPALYISNKLKLLTKRNANANYYIVPLSLFEPTLDCQRFFDAL